jgi:hypothetical protein
MQENIKTNSEMLNLIRAERPNQVINEVLSFKINEHGFYDAIVDMQLEIFGTTIKHTKQRLAYPIAKLLALAVEEQNKWINYDVVGNNPLYNP